MNPIAAHKGLLVVAATALALLAAGCAPIRLAPTDSDQRSPATHASTQGVTVVWEDSRNEETAGADIYMYDVKTATEQLVAGGSGDQEQPAISNRYLVWIDAGRLRAKDLSSGAVFNVTNGPATQTDPAVCGSVVVWSDTANNSDVYAKDLAVAGGSQIAVATSPAVEAYPACDAGRVVYMYSAAGGSADIRLRNIGTGETVVVSDQYWNEWRPAISEDRVVWQAWPTQPDTVDGIQIMGKRLSTGETFTVTSGPGHQTAPTISRSVVAWEDARPGQPADTRLWWRDLETTTGEKPTDTLTIGAQLEPALSERGLVYRSSQPTGLWNVWRVGLSSE